MTNKIPAGTPVVVGRDDGETYRGTVVECRGSTPYSPVLVSRDVRDDRLYPREEWVCVRECKPAVNLEHERRVAEAAARGLSLGVVWNI